jgi:hypothetical protein
LTAPAIIVELVERFTRNRASYTASGYKEAHVRKEFLDPFFEALGWDMQNRAGYAEAYKDVVHEDAIKVGGSTKAPDYAFRIGGTRKFFVEAKQPAVKIREDIDPAYQLRRYAWSAKLPLSILTDFEEFAVYDCRIKPDHTDTASVARTMFIRYTEYPARWDEIASIFSREAILKGSFDKYAEATCGKRGTAEVDSAFLQQIERWREDLAHNLALRNPSLTVRELNFAVQRTIDRLIFLRICEDRGIEDPDRLRSLTNGPHIYERLTDLFRQADMRYNSGLFHFSEEAERDEATDTLTLSLAIDDKLLRDLIKGMYYPESPYEFSVLPADILGQVYEQFLGKVIRLTSGHQAKVEEKPEVRKAGGVYYTPTYIVEYIVRQTVGQLLEGKTPRQVAGAHDERPLRVADPACGSGSFLIGAYQFLLDWHRDWYLANLVPLLEAGKAADAAEVRALLPVRPPAKRGRRAAGGDTALPVYLSKHEGATADWRLTTAERKRILLTHIFGVDIDAQAVEVTKMSLLLKVLEGENEQTLSQQLSLFHERALPDLGANIQCGNSLVGPDFYDNQQMALLPSDEQYRINAFDWRLGFPEVFTSQNPGFDAVIGNPPWGGDIDRELEYLHRKYPASTQEHTDSYKLFIDASLRIVRVQGFISMIVPNTVLRQKRIRDVRSLLMTTRLIALVDLGEDVFERVVAPSCIFTTEKLTPIAGHQVAMIDITGSAREDKANQMKTKIAAPAWVKQAQFGENTNTEFMIPLRKYSVVIGELGTFKEYSCKDAGINYQRVKVGMQEKGRSDLADRLLYEGDQQSSQDKMYWKGSDISRYWMAETTARFCRANYREFLRPNEVVHLSPKVYETVPKILIRQTADRIIATTDAKGVWFGRSLLAVVPSVDCVHRIEYLLGVLNSQYMSWVYQESVNERGRVFAQVKLSKLKVLPIRLIDFSDPLDSRRHDRMVALVERMMVLQKQIKVARTEQERIVLERQADATDHQIDQLVFELYELTPEEISIVEGRT